MQGVNSWELKEQEANLRVPGTVVRLLAASLITKMDLVLAEAMCCWQGRHCYTAKHLSC